MRLFITRAARTLALVLGSIVLASCGGGRIAGNGSGPSVPSAPVTVSATAGNAQVVISWAPVSGASSYVVQRSALNGGPASDIGSSEATSYVDAGLVNGVTYFYTVSAIGAAGRGAASGVVSATPDPAIPLPAAPQGVVAAADDGEIQLAWAQTPNATVYHVRRALQSVGPYTAVASPTGTTYADTGLTDGTTYFYVVSAQDASGEGPNSAPVSATPAAVPATPAPVTSVSAVPGNGSVTISWPASAGATGYVVVRATTSGGPYSTLTAAAASPVFDQSVSNGTTYFYEVVAENASGASSPSVPVSSRPTDVVAPASIPVGLTGVAGNRQVALTWQASTSAVGYSVERATESSGPYSVIATAPQAAYTDTSVQNGVPYYYVVSAIGSDGVQSAPSNEITAIPTLPPILPAVPSSLSASATNGQVALTWAASAGASGYAVKRSTQSGEGFIQIAAPVSTTYTDAAIANGTTYYYVVAATAGGNLQSANSAEVSARPQGPPVPPTAPTGLTAVAGNGSITLSWSASIGATAYNVLRSTTSGAEVQIVGPIALQPDASGTVSYTDTVSNGQSYYYVVQAIDSGSSPSASSGEVVAYPAVPALAVPQSLQATAGNASVTLTWIASYGASAYNVIRGTTSGGESVVSGPLALEPDGSGMLSYTDTAANGTTYYYVVQAVDTFGHVSALSVEVSATPSAPQGTPSGLTARAGNGSVTLTWNAASGAAAYDVLRSTLSGHEVKVAGPLTLSVSATGTVTYIDGSTPLTNGQPYFYTVQAERGGAPGQSSNEVVATPIAAPSSPGGLVATASDGSATLIWTAPVGAVTYSIFRGSGPGQESVLVANQPLRTDSNGAVTYQDATLQNGLTYYYRIQAQNAGGISPYSNEASVSLAAPAAPAKVIATPATDAATQASVVNLSWSAVVGSSGYAIFRSNSAGTESQYVPNWAGGAQYTDRGVTPGNVYYYVVRALNGSFLSDSSNEVSALAGLPPAPVALTAVAGANEVTLNWTQVISATSYVVTRATSTGAYSVSITCYPFSLGVPSPGIVSCTDASAVDGSSYIYTVASSDGAGVGAAGSAATVSLTTPPAPANLIVAASTTPGTHASSISLTWDTVPGGYPYRILRSNTSGKESQVLATTSGNAYTDTNVTPGAAYFYVIQAVNGSLVGPNSNEVSAIAGAPGAPTNLVATTATNATNTAPSILLVWTTVPGGFPYTIIRGTTAGAESMVLATTISNAYTDTSVVPGATYYYVVQAANGSVSGPKSNEASAIAGPPTAPANLQASVVSGKVNLSWNATFGATSYTVSRTTSNPTTHVSFACSPVSAAATAVTCIDDTVASALYTYVVQAVNGVGTSGNSNVATVNLLAPTAPSNLIALVGKNPLTNAPQIGLGWNTTPGGYPYTVLRGSAPGNEAEILATVTGNAYTDTNVVLGSQYYYVVQATNGVNTSPNSNEASAIAGPPLAPTSLQASVVSGGVNLSWSAALSATSYNLIRTTSSPATRIIVSCAATASPSKLACTDTAAVPGAVYTYTVQAVNGYGSSSNSDAVTINLLSPAAPANLVAIVGKSSITGVLQIGLGWNPVPGSFPYAVLRGTAPGKETEVLATTVGTAYTDSSVTPGSTYYYVVQAINGAISSPKSNEATATAGPPAAPAQLSASVGTGQIGLGWTIVNGATSYVVTRTTAVPATSIVVTCNPYTPPVAPATSVACPDTAVASGVKYTYVVQAANGAGLGTASNSVSASLTGLPAPSLLTAVSGTNPLTHAVQIGLGWTASSATATYTIFRSTAPGSETSYAGNISGIKFTDTAVTPGTTYYYVVQANQGPQTSPKSNEASATPGAAPTPPDLTAAALDSVVWLHWNPVRNATSYSIARDGHLIGSVAAATTPLAYKDVHLVNGTRYTYQVSAISGASTLHTSNVVSATPVPVGPYSLWANAGDGQITLEWKYAAGVSYTIKRGVSSGAETTLKTALTLQPTDATNYVSFTDTGLINNQAYFYVVQASDGVTSSPSWQEVSATPRSLTPLTASDLSTALQGLRAATVGSLSCTTAMVTPILDHFNATTLKFSDAGYYPASTPANPLLYPPTAHVKETLTLATDYLAGTATTCHTPAVWAVLEGALSLALQDSQPGQPYYYYPYYDTPPQYVNSGFYAELTTDAYTYAKTLALLASDPDPLPGQSAFVVRASAHVKDMLDASNIAGIGTGDNRIGIAVVTALKGLSARDPVITAKGYAAIGRAFDVNYSLPPADTAYLDSPDSELTVSGDGIKPDHAWQEHGAQLYNGGYGVEALNRFVEMANYAQNNGLGQYITRSRLANLGDLVFDGDQWLQYRTLFDFATFGRDISRAAGSSIGWTTIRDVAQLINTPAANLAYETWKANIYSGGPSGVLGNKHFYSSDFMVQRGNNYHLSVKVPSTRTNATESMTDENRKGYNLALGATNVSVNGQELMVPTPYGQSTPATFVFPAWDWSRIPGTTTEFGSVYQATGDVPNPAKAGSVGGVFVGTNPFAGGVSSGSYGIMAFSADYQGVEAAKAYFFLGDEMYCLGAGITANKAGNVLTSVAQSLYKPGTLQSSIVGNPNGVAAAAGSAVLHDNIGYLFPRGGTVVLQTAEQQGKWSDIGKTPTNVADSVTEPVFSLWINHSSSPSGATYEYVVVPNVSSYANLTNASAFPYEPAINSASVQAIHNTRNSVYGMVFYVAGSVTFADGLSVSVDRPTLLMAQISPNTAGHSYVFWASDPLSSSSRTPIHIAVNRSLSYGGASLFDPVAKVSMFSITPPVGAAIGSSAAIVLTGQ